MILKYIGEHGDEKVPECYSGTEWCVVGKDTKHVWVLLAIRPATNEHTAEYRIGSPVPGSPRHLLSMKVTDWLHEIMTRGLDKRTAEKLQFVDHFTERGLDDVLEVVYDEVLRHNVGRWSATFSGNEIDSGWYVTLVGSIKPTIRWVMKGIFKNRHTIPKDIVWIQGQLMEIATRACV